jgi:chromosome segregation ATPase
MSHDPDHPAFKHPLTRAVDAVIEAVEHVVHSQRADLLRHALAELITRLLEQVAATSSTMSVLAHQRIEALAARLHVLEGRLQVLDMQPMMTQMTSGFAEMHAHLTRQDVERQALQRELQALREELASLERRVARAERSV